MTYDMQCIGEVVVEDQVEETVEGQNAQDPVVVHVGEEVRIELRLNVLVFGQHQAQGDEAEGGRGA